MNAICRHIRNRLGLSVVELAEGLVGLMTLGLWLPDWSFNYLAWTLIREAKLREREPAALTEGTDNA